LGLGSFVGWFHGSAFPYFWMTTGLFLSMALTMGCGRPLALAGRLTWPVVVSLVVMAAIQSAQESVEMLVDTQRDNLYAGSTSIVTARSAISNALRSLITSTEPTAATLEQVRATVLDQSGLYGELDGENVAAYATAFAQVEASLSEAQRSRLMELRRSFMAGTYADGTPFDFTLCDTYFLFAAEIDDFSLLSPYLSDTDRFFTFAGGPSASFTASPESPLAGHSTQLTDTSAGSPTSWSWSFGDGGTSTLQNPTHTWSTAGSYTVSLTATNASGSNTATRTIAVRDVAGSVCTPGTTVLCLDGTVEGDRRFKVEVSWSTVQGGNRSGQATAVATDVIGFDRGGIFWFFDAGNPEMLVKILDGCGVNSRFWVYAAATTNVGLDLRVTDTTSGLVKSYVNRDLTPALPVQDIAAFACN
jgi:PKD repeat protein